MSILEHSHTTLYAMQSFLAIVPSTFNSQATSLCCVTAVLTASVNLVSGFIPVFVFVSFFSDHLLIFILY